MTSEELYNKYIDVVVLIMEEVGNETNNNVYKEVEKVIREDNKNLLEMILSDDVDFEVFIVMIMFMIVKKIHGVDNLYESGEASGLAMDLFTRYLEKPTRRFSGKYGLGFDRKHLNALTIEIIKFNKDKDNG